MKNNLGVVLVDAARGGDFRVHIRRSFQSEDACASVESADWSNRSEAAEEEGDGVLVEGLDGEEFTNKIPDIEASWDANQQTHQMCLIHRDFKHFAASKANHFRPLRKDSSIMRAKLLSIMRARTKQVTMG